MAAVDSTLPTDAPRARAPWKLGLDDWKQAVVRAWEQRADDDLTARAAAVAFSGMLALPTLLIAVVSLYGLVASPGQIERLVAQLEEVAPAPVAEALSGQLRAIDGQSDGALSAGLLLGLAGSVWSVSGGIGRLRGTINEVYGEEDARPWYIKRIATIAAAVAAIAFVTVSLGLIAALPALLGAVGIGGWSRTLLLLARWPLLAVLMMSAIAALFRWGPDRRPPRWQWISVGTVLATLAWILVSIGFSVYVENFGSYNETYGSLASAVIFLMWLYLTSFVLLLAGELNSELEHQTIADSTIGPDRPLGQRDAYVADHHPSVDGRDRSSPPAVLGPAMAGTTIEPSDRLPGKGDT